jgi:hypothetical protein
MILDFAFFYILAELCCGIHGWIGVMRSNLAKL